MSNPVEVSFVPSLVADMTEVTIPRDGPAMVTATAYGFSADANVTFVIDAGTDFESSDDGSTLTLTRVRLVKWWHTLPMVQLKLLRSRYHLCQRLLNWFQMPLIIWLKFQ